MGGIGSKTKLTAESVNRAVTSVVTNSIQNATSQSTQDQLIKVNCTDYNKQMVRFVLECYAQYPNEKVEVLERLCNPSIFLGCGINGLEMKQAVNVDFKTDQQKASNIFIQTDLDTKIKATIKETTGLIDIGNSVEEDIKTLNETVQTFVTNDIQNILQTSKQQQTIYLENGAITAVKLDQFSDAIFKNVQTNTAVLNAVTKLVADVDVEIDKQPMDVGLLAGIIAGSIGGLLIIIAIVTVVIRRKKQNATLKQATSLPAPEG